MPWDSLCTEAHSGPGKEAGPLWLLLKWRCIFIYIFWLSIKYIFWKVKLSTESTLTSGNVESESRPPAEAFGLHKTVPLAVQPPSSPAASWNPRNSQASGSSPGHMSLGACPYPLLPATCVTPWSDEPLLLHCSSVPATVHVSHMGKTLSRSPLCLLAKDWLYVADTW